MNKNSKLVFPKADINDNLESESAKYCHEQKIPIYLLVDGVKTEIGWFKRRDLRHDSFGFGGKCPFKNPAYWFAYCVIPSYVDKNHISRCICEIILGTRENTFDKEIPVLPEINYSQVTNGIHQVIGWDYTHYDDDLRYTNLSEVIEDFKAVWNFIHS